MIVCESFPLVNPVSSTTTEPVRVDVPGLAAAVMVISLVFFLTLIQESLLVALNVPSVVTVTIALPPSFENSTEVGLTVSVLPLCVISTVLVILLFVPTKVTEPLRSLGVLFSARLMLINWVPVPDVDDRTIQLSEARAVQASLVVRLTASEYSEELAVIAVLSMSNEYSVPNCVMITSCEALPSVKPVI